MRVFKPTYTYNGTKRTSAKWNIDFRDHRGVRRRVVAFTDKRATAQLGERIEALVANRKMRAPADPDLAAWLESIPSCLRDKLHDFDMIDARVATLTEYLTALVDDYHTALIAKGTSEPHADLHRARCLKVVNGCGFRHWADLHAGAVERWLFEQRKAGMTTNTSNHFVVAIKGFANWMVKDGRASASPLARLSKIPVTDEKQRGTLTVEQMQTLLTHTRTSSPYLGLKGTDRAMLYRVAIETGMRAGAIRSLTVRSFRLDTEPPTVTIQAGQQKNRRRHEIPLRKRLADELRDHLALKGPDAPAFASTRYTAKMIRHDLEAAGLPPVDAEGNVIDFHSLRHTTGTWLSEMGVDLKVVQRILGHRTFAMTADRYTHVDRKRVAREMERTMPDLHPLRATGTDSCAILAQTGAEQCGSMRTTPQPTRSHGTINTGQVAERLNAPVSKTGMPFGVSWVRIPPCPFAVKDVSRPA